jgi:hypothetical protein
MLTQEQKDKLEPLTNYKRFGKLLIDAMHTWEFSKPVCAKLGITRYSKDKELVKFFEFSDSDIQKECCLVGASLFGKQSDFITVALNDYFNIDTLEMIHLESGFDSHDGHDPRITTEAFEFGKSVGKIVFEKKYLL